MHVVTAKVTCTGKSAGYGDSVALSFQPDYADGRNAAWAAATPSLSLSMTVKGDVANEFEQGARYTLSFEPSEKVESFEHAGDCAAVKHPAGFEPEAP